MIFPVSVWDEIWNIDDGIERYPTLMDFYGVGLEMNLIHLLKSAGLGWAGLPRGQFYSPNL